MDAWTSIFRIAVGGYWLYFASQKWMGVEWVRPLIQKSPSVNPIPGLHEFLAVLVAPNWFIFAVLQTAGETTVAVLLILGLFTRAAALLGLLLAAGLALTIAFLDADIGSRWLYYLAVLVNAQVLFAGAGPLALDRRFGRRRWLAS
ncbi:MAG TPA: DoxX family membrane protein [Candidatus Dormibacteraeota bacterium]